MADLIYTRSASDTFLRQDQVQRLAPAAFATSVSTDLSAKYGNFNTAHAIDVMADNGYFVTQAAQVKSRTASAAHGQHLLAFAKDWSGTDSERPEVVLYNSHDGKSSMKLFAGVYRFICSNGIVAGEGFDQRMTHYASNLDSFEHLLNYTIGTLQDVTEATRNMKGINTDMDQQIEFAKRALSLRFDDALATDFDERTRPGFNRRTIKNALSPVRVGDVSNDSWTVFNRVQESVIRGTVNVLGKRTRRGVTFEGYKQAKPLSAIKQVVDVNRQLWDLAQETLVAA